MQGKRDDRRGRRTRFLPDRRGGVAVEFALVSIPLIAVLLGALQTAVVFFFDQALQTVTNNVARQVLVGSVQTQGLSKSQFQSLVCSAAQAQATPFSCSGLIVDIQSASSFSNLNTAPLTLTYNSSGQATNTSYSPGAQGSAVILRVMYQWPVFGGPLGIGLANQSNGTYLMVATSVFKTEPY